MRASIAMLIASQTLEDLDFFLVDLALDNAETAKFGGLLLARRHQHVVRARLSSEADVGARWAGLRRRVRVVDHHRLLIAIVHLPPDPQLLHRVELVERR